MPEPLSQPPIVSFWHGPMTWLERLSITSFLEQGHRFQLYSYTEIPDLPPGTEQVDARTILPHDLMFFYKGTGTPAVFADLFRLEFMHQQIGIWADCDMICRAPFTGLGDHIFGYELSPGPTLPHGSINNAVFHCPADSPLLADLLSIFDPKNINAPTPWLPLHRRVEIAMRRFFGQQIKPSDMQFGATGPFPLTWFVRHNGLADLALPREVFYPVPYTKIPTLMRPGSDVQDHVTAATLGIHIWRSQLTRRGRADLPAPEPDSAMAKLCAAFDIDPTK